MSDRPETYPGKQLGPGARRDADSTRLESRVELVPFWSFLFLKGFECDGAVSEAVSVSVGQDRAGQGAVGCGGVGWGAVEWGAVGCGRVGCGGWGMVGWVLEAYPCLLGPGAPPC